MKPVIKLTIRHNDGQILGVWTAKTKRGITKGQLRESIALRAQLVRQYGRTNVPYSVIREEAL